MAVGGLYQTVDASQRALAGYQGAAQTLAAVPKGSKTVTEQEKEKSAGGALSAGLGGAAAGSIAGPYGAAAGAAVGILAYYL